MNFLCLGDLYLDIRGSGRREQDYRGGKIIRTMGTLVTGLLREQLDIGNDSLLSLEKINNKKNSLNLINIY